MQPQAQHIQDMTPIELAKESFAAVQGDIGRLTQIFHAALATQEPMAQQMLRRGMLDHTESFEDSLRKTLDRLECPARLILPLRRIGQLHHANGVKPRHYTTIIGIFIDSMASVAGDKWKPAYEKAWYDLLGFIAATMQSGLETPAIADPAETAPTLRRLAT